jgi:hypothetical protein
MLFGEWILPFPVFSMVYTSLRIKDVRILQSMRRFLVLLSISTINKNTPVRQATFGCIVIYDSLKHNPRQKLQNSRRWGMQTLHETNLNTGLSWLRNVDRGASNSASLTRFKTQTSRILTHCVESIQVDERDDAVCVDLI